MTDCIKKRMESGDLPLLAILRGVKSEQVVAISRGIVEAGINWVEVPLNSPTAFTSIEKLVAEFGDDVLCGAGTVLSVPEVVELHHVGGKLVVAPNCDVAVIEKSLELGMIPMPGVATPTEALMAISAGARFLKLFPAVGVGEAYLKNMMAVLPCDITVLGVGGINASNMASFWQAGARGFGIGGDIFKPGDSTDTVSAKACEIVSAFKAIQQ